MCHTATEYCAVKRQNAGFMCPYLFAKLASSAELGSAQGSRTDPTELQMSWMQRSHMKGPFFSCGDGVWHHALAVCQADAL